MKEYSVIFAGDAGTGKTTFTRSLINNKFEGKYIPTDDVEFTSIQFNGVDLLIWDTAGQEFYNMNTNYYAMADAAIVFYDTTNNLSMKNSNVWINRIRSISPNIPIIICGTKNELPLKAKFRDSDTHCIISTINGVNTNKPLELLVNKLN